MRVLRMITLRCSGLLDFVDYKVSLLWIFPLDILIYAVRQRIDLPRVTLKNQRGLFLRLGTTDPYVWAQIFVEKEYESPVLEYCQPSVVIDLGAYTGYSSFYFSQRFPDAQIIAIEANLENYFILRSTFSGNSRVHVIHAAIHNSDGQKLTVKVAKDGLWGSRALAPDLLNVLTNELSVETISVSTLMNKFDLLNKSDMFLKIDIEGGELEVFDTRVPLWKHFGVIAIETHERIRPGCTATFAVIASHYKVTTYRGDLTFVSSPLRG